MNDFGLESFSSGKSCKEWDNPQCEKVNIVDMLSFMRYLIPHQPTDNPSLLPKLQAKHPATPCLAQAQPLKLPVKVSKLWYGLSCSWTYFSEEYMLLMLTEKSVGSFSFLATA